MLSGDSKQLQPSRLCFLESFFPVVWITFPLYWQVKAAGTKTTQRFEPPALRILRALALLI